MSEQISCDLMLKCKRSWKCWIKQRCDTQFQHTFDTCSCVWFEPTKVISLKTKQHAVNPHENATAYSKRTLKTRVATNLKAWKCKRDKRGTNMLIVLFFCIEEEDENKTTEMRERENYFIYFMRQERAKMKRAVFCLFFSHRKIIAKLRWGCLKEDTRICVWVKVFLENTQFVNLVTLY